MFKKIVATIITFVMAVGIILTGSITADAATTDVLVAALIQGDQVVVTGSISTQSEDGILHLYAQEPYESGTSGTEVAQAIMAQQSGCLI